MTAADIASIVALGAPVLCLDTCTILDVMRDPTRETARTHERLAALELLSAIETGPSLVGLVADQVRLEFAEHVQAVEEEAERALKKLRSQMARIDELTAVFGGSGKTDLSHLINHVSRSRAVVDRYVAAARSASQSSHIASRALLRLNQARSPAKKGKDSMKDCVVIETYLDVVASLRAAGHQRLCE
jgi:hypothetical protein